MKKLKLLTSAMCLGIASCTSSSPYNFSNTDSNKAQGVEQVERIIVNDASPTQCPSGGKVYIVYVDVNNNHINDGDETPVSTQVVCNGQNGANGSDGLSTLLAMNRLSTTASTCAAESGLQINSGLDQNRNGSLDPSEINQTQLVCDGQNGSIGASGPAGSNGHSMQYSVLTAASQVCPAGGSTLLMALDIHDRGYYSPTDPNQQQMTICNGQNGTNAQTPSYSPMDAILPCGNTVSYKEVLLRLNNGQVLAAFSDNASGLNTRLALLSDGTYLNTDGSGCTFSLTSSSDGHQRSISWFNQVQKTWTVQ